MDPQALDLVDMGGKCVNPHEAVKEALTTKTAGARANPTPSAGGSVPRSPDLLGSGNGTHNSGNDFFFFWFFNFIFQCIFFFHFLS